MAHEHHHADASEPSAVAGWFVAMVLFVVIALAMAVALFAWAPWEDDTVGGGETDTQQQDDTEITSTAGPT